MTGASGLRAEVRVHLGALDLDVALEVGADEVVALVGPNGAGKTTLLRALAGLVPLDAGRVELDGTVLEDAATGARLPPERRRVGVAFQDALLFPHLSAVDNVAFGLRCDGRSRAESRRAARAWLERFDLAGHADARPRSLSGGQAQRVALARALAPGPSLLLLDEPLAALDADARPRLRAALRRHLRDGAVAPGARLLVTHDPVDALVLADRLVVLEGGRVTQAGAPTEVRARPRSAYVARLLGLNLLPGRVVRGTVRLASGADLATAEVPAEGSEVLVSIRPQAVAVHLERPTGSPRNAWPATVEAIDVEGARARVRLEGAVPLLAEVTSSSVAELALAEGSAVWAGVKAVDVEVAPA